MLVGDDDQLEVLDAVAARAERALELVERRAGVRTAVDERERVVLDEVRVDAADLKRRRDRQAVDGGFGGACETTNDGDPVVLYDQFADRWLISQFTASSPYNECIAISKTADPTGAYNLYAFQLSTTDFPDYPHFGIAPDGYYMSVNWFTGGATATST